MPEDNDSVPGDNLTGLFSTKEVMTESATQQTRIAESIAWLKAHSTELSVTALRIFKCNNNFVMKAWSQAKQPQS